MKRNKSSSTNLGRQFEYFVPRDGIAKEVIQADICRYLGNDALVRPGTYTDNTGRVTEGYFITAYRNLTTLMVAGLKNDSLRWQKEKARVNKQQQPVTQQQNPLSAPSFTASFYRGGLPRPVSYSGDSASGDRGFDNSTLAPPDSGALED